MTGIKVPSVDIHKEASAQKEDEEWVGREQSKVKGV